LSKFNVELGDIVKMEIPPSLVGLLFPIRFKEAYGYIENFVESEHSKCGTYAVVYWYCLSKTFPVEADKVIKINETNINSHDW
jgi:hypothetical protein